LDLHHLTLYIPTKVSTTALAIVFAVLSGVAGSFQIAVNGTFGRELGVLEATMFSTVVAALSMCLVVLVVRRSYGGVAVGLHHPPWLWLGGVLSAFLVMSFTFSVPHLGVYATIGLLLAGQLIMGMIIDSVGLFRPEALMPTWSRVAGLVLISVGAALTLRT
jgi:transporter family-2 protein